MLRDVEIRKANDKDIDALVELLYELFSIEVDFDFDEEKQRKGLELICNDEASCVLVAECDDQVVGMVTMQTLISTAEGGSVGLLEDMVIRQSHRGQGIGRKLLDGIEHWSQSNGLARLQLLADKENEPALRFYDSMGWTRTNLVCRRKA